MSASHRCWQISAQCRVHGTELLVSLNYLNTMHTLLRIVMHPGHTREKEREWDRECLTDILLQANNRIIKFSELWLELATYANWTCHNSLRIVVPLWIGFYYPSEWRPLFFIETDNGVVFQMHWQITSAVSIE